MILDPTFTFTTAKLGTDNKKSFLLIYICNNPKGITTGKLLFIVLILDLT